MHLSLTDLEHIGQTDKVRKLDLNKSKTYKKKKQEKTNKHKKEKTKNNNGETTILH